MAGDYLRDLSMRLDLETNNSGLSQIIQMNRRMNEITRATRIFDRQFRNSMDKMPEHLKPFAKQIYQTDLEFRNFTRNATYSLEEMQDAVLKTRVGLGSLTSVSSSGKGAIKMMQGFNAITRETRLAILGFNKDATRKLAPEEVQQQLVRQNRAFSETREKLEALRDAGNIGAYTAGMRSLQQSLMQVENALKSAALGGDSFLDTLSELNVNTQATADAAALQMEYYKEAFLNSFDRIMAKSTQTQAVINNLGNLSPLYGLSRGTLAVANGLENMAKRGTAAALALKILGRDASMSEIRKMMRLINAGLVRMQQLTIGVGLAWVAVTAVLTQAALGPDPSEVRAQQDQVTDAYTQAFNDRYNEIRNFAGMFEEVTSNFVNPATLQKNLQHQVEVLQNWTRNLKSLSSRGLSEGFIDELRKMGPAAAGEIAALNQMTDQQLNKYVATWKAKNEIARQQTMSELDKMREETQQKVKALSDSLTPLGLAWEELKASWSGAAAPFVELFGQVAAGFVKIGKYVGDFFTMLNNISPWITKLGGAFLYLTLTLTLLLAPMAVGIGLSGGLAASFTALWAVIGPFVIGLATVLGVAAGIAAAIVAVGAALYFAYKYITPFREAVNSAFDAIKQFFNGVLMQIKAFWATNGPMIMQAVQNIVNVMIAIFNYFKPFFTLLWQGFLFIVRNVWEGIKGAITAAVNIILNIVAIFGALFTGNWSALWTAVKNLLWNVVLLIWNIIKMSFVGQIIALFSQFKGKVTSVFTSIKNFFVNIWNTIVNFVKAVITAHVFFVILMFVKVYTAIKEKMMLIKTTIMNIWNAVKAFFEGINLYEIGVNILKGLINGIMSMAGKVKDTVSSIATSISDTFTGFMDIHSPSRRFKMYGVHTIEGYNEGLQQAQPSAIKQMAGFGEKVSQPMQSYADESPNRLAPASGTTNNSTITMPDVKIIVEGNVDSSVMPDLRNAGEEIVNNMFKRLANSNIVYLEG